MTGWLFFWQWVPLISIIPVTIAILNRCLISFIQINNLIREFIWPDAVAHLPAAGQIARAGVEIVKLDDRVFGKLNRKIEFPEPILNFLSPSPLSYWSSASSLILTPSSDKSLTQPSRLFCRDRMHLNRLAGRNICTA